VGGAQPHEAAQQQAGANQHHKSQGHLHYHQRVAHPAPRAPGAGSAGALRHGGAQIHPRGGQRRRQPEQNPARERNCQGEQQHPPIHSDEFQPRDGGRSEILQQRNRHPRQQRAQHTPGQAQYYAFAHQAERDLHPGGAEGGANGDFLPPAGSARQQQVGDVGAGDPEQQRDRPQQHQQRLPDVAHQLVLERKQRRPPAAIERRIGLLQLATNGSQLPAGRRQRGSPPQSRDPGQIPRATRTGVGGIQNQGKKNLHSRLFHLESRRQHAHHHVALVAQPDRLAGDGLVGAETALPERIGEHGHIGASRLVFFLAKNPAHNRLHTEELEQSGGNPLGF
jgi:hypothetical protein